MGKGSLFEVGDNVEFARMLLHLSIVVVFIVILEKLLHKLQHGLKRYPKYHEMLTKVYGELMILGFISLCIKLLKEVAELDSYNSSLIAFQAADLAVFILAIALILQSICVYLRLRAKNILWDKAELLGSEALLAIIQEHKESARTTAPQATKKSNQPVRPQDFFELVQMRLIRHYFLQKMGLPELFPFAKYLRQAQENQITHMIEVKVTTWIMLLALAWVMHLIAIVVGEKDDMSESEALVPAFAAFSWLILFVHFAIHQYFERAIRHLLTTATHFTGRSQWLVCLEEITQHELKFASAEVASDAIETMTRVRDNERAREGHGRRRALISRAKKILRSSRGSRKIEDHAPERQTRSAGVEEATSDEAPVVVKHFSKEVWHVVIVLALMVNAFSVALFVQCIAFQLADVYDKSGIAMIVVLILPAIVNVVFLQPKIMWGFTLVSSVVRVDVTTLSEVIDHFIETVELRSQLVELILGHLDDTGKAIGALRTALLAEDPQKTGLIDVDDLRDLLGDFGVQLSFFRFNSVARLVFDLEGTMVPYDQLICLLEIAQMSGFDLGAPSESDESFHLLPLRSTGATSVQIPEDEEVDGLRHQEYVSPHRSVTAHRRGRASHGRHSLLHSASHSQVLSLYRLHGPSHIIDENLPRSSMSAVAPRHGGYTLDARQLKRACGKRDAEWSELSNAITELADVVEALPELDHREAIKDHLVPLAEELEELLRNIRSKLVSDACEQLGRIVKATRLAFAPVANLMLQGLADTAKASSKAIREPGFRLFSDVSEYSRYDLEIIHKMYRNSPQERVRALLLEQLHIALTYWPKHEVEPSYKELMELMSRGLRDPSNLVRPACRQTFCLFCDVWEERMEELVDVPTTQARSLLIKEKPHATISKAMVRKYGSTPSKAIRADSVSAIRQRSVSKRQGSTTGDDAFIEVTESPRRPLQRPATDAQKRSASPGRATPRAPSPSAATRGGAVRNASAPRAPSPPPAGRSASPGATPRSASPLFGAAQGPSGGATGGRTSSPGRSTKVSSPRVNGNNHASGALSAKDRLGEFDRFLSLTAQDKSGFKGEEERANGLISPPREKSQKRVSIAEPPVMDPTRTLSFSSAMSSTPFQSSVQASKTTTQPSWKASAAARDTSSFDPMCTSASFGARGAKMPAATPRPSLGFDAAPTTSYAAAAQSFVSQSHQMQCRDEQPSTAHFSNEEEPRASVPDNARQQAPSRAAASRAREIPTAPDRERESQDFSFPESRFQPDAFLDRPIPSSAPAPEPRASTNVTTRGRRPPSSHSMNRVFENGTIDEVKPPAPVPATLVPEPQRHVEVRPQVARPRFLDETFPPPPSASIDSAFLQSNMASAAPRADELDLGHRDDPFSGDETSEDKENVGIGQENIPSKPTSKQANASAMDAISVLGALRGNFRATNEKLEAAQAAPPMKQPFAPPLPTQPHTVTVRKSAASTQPQLPPSQAQARASLQIPAHEVRVEEKKIAPNQVIQDRPQRPSAPTQVKQTIAPGPHSGVVTAVQPPKARPVETSSLRSPPAQATSPPNLNVRGGPTSGPQQQPPTDFVRAPQPFKFAAPQPRQQQVKAPASAPLARVSASAAPDSRPRSEPGIFERNGLDARRDDHQERERLGEPMIDLAAGLRQRQPPHEQSRIKSAASETSSQADSTSSAFAKRHTVLNPKLQRVPSNIAVKMLYSFALVLVAIFGLSGLIEAATKVRNAYEYHQLLLDRINQFESSIVESYESVRKMNEKYAVWSEYVRELTDQDETNALHQLESIQTEVEKWQRDMKTDLLEFKKSLSGDIIDAALAPLRDSNGSDQQIPDPAT